MTHENTAMLAALAAATEDRIVLDLTGIEARYRALISELPGLTVRFAMKCCPVDEVLACLAALGSGVDAASVSEVEQALAAGVPLDRVHFGNTVKSDRDIAAAHRLGVRTFATDSPEDVDALAAHAPGARVYCRVSTDGGGALWGLNQKFGCSPADAVAVLERARDAGLVPAGLSVHVGSQQMTAGAWARALGHLVAVIGELRGRGIRLDHVNLGGGLPALGYLDKKGRRLEPPLAAVFTAVREGMRRCREAAGGDLDFVMEPGRHLVADHGAIRAHVARLTTRHGRHGERQRWLYLSCGKFNGLYEMDELQYRLVFPTHLGAPSVPAVVAGPTCDSDDAFSEQAPVAVPEAVASGDPVWVLSAGAYAVSYTTQGFNGFGPLPYECVRAEPASATEGGR